MEQHLHTSSAEQVALHTAELWDEFKSLLDAGELSAEKVSYLSKATTANILAFYRETGSCLREGISLLCEVTNLNSPQLAEIGVNYLFSELIEVINDSFDPSICPLYDQLFAQVITFYRTQPYGKFLDLQLNHFHLRDELAVLQRRKRLGDYTITTTPSRVRKIIVLSRVTIGADIAITSIILSRLKTNFPQAEIVLIGSAKLNQLYGGDSSIRVKSLDYGRHGDVVSRLNSWVELCQLVADEVAPLNFDEYLIFDPDSRFTQLGLLPLLQSHVERQAYSFFPSRTIGGQGTQSLGNLTNQWLGSIGLGEGQSFPFLAIPSYIRNPAEHLVNLLHLGGSNFITTLSFGVGGNSRKRLGASFEESLAYALSQKSTLIIDCGATPEEVTQASELLQFLQYQGCQIIELDETTLPPFLQQTAVQADVVSWKGGIGSFAALIKVSDQYVGYDSAGQHIAAALGVTSTSIFVHIPSSIFAYRWHPLGSAPTRVILADPREFISPNSLIQQIFP